jgi:hypothetical protein
MVAQDCNLFLHVFLSFYFCQTGMSIRRLIEKCMFCSNDGLFTTYFTTHSMYTLAD